MTKIKERPARVAKWLFFCAFMVFVMAIIGAITRLSEAGLSITEWKPVTGAIPPLTHADWMAEFEKYRATPEYLKKNSGMALADFQYIYFWEWIHRFWGRLIGIAFAVPLVFFWVCAWIPRGFTWKLLLLLLLGGAQGFVGWFMVQSGLIDRPSVSHYRLALHLFMALLLFALLLWVGLSIRATGRVRPVGGAVASRWLKAHTILALLFVISTMVWGAFVAGLDAGLIYNEFPTMGEGRLIPVEMWHATPAWINLFENHAAVQFTHRALAVLTVLVVLALASHALLADVRGAVFPAVAIMALLQAGLGISTLLTNVSLHVAVTHHAGAITMLGLMVICLHTVFRRNPS